MSILVIGEHDNAQLKESTLNTVTAATLLGDDIHLLIAGEGCRGVADAACSVAGISKVLVVDDARYGHHLAESLSLLATRLAPNYSHLLAPATSICKNFLPRVAALLDMAQISDVIAIESEDTFVRPIYAGNALATVHSSDSIKLITIRTTAFEAASAEGGGG